MGPYAVRTGQIVYVNDSALFLAPLGGKTSVDDNDESRLRDIYVKLRFFVDIVDPMFQVQTGTFESATDVLVTGYTALFGGDLSATPPSEQTPLRFGHGEGTRVLQDVNNPYGCLPYSHGFDDAVMLIDRGECTFLDKLTHARSAGAAGIVVVSDEEFGINPTAGKEELALAEDLNEVVLVVLTRSVGKLIRDMIGLADARGVGQLMLALDPEGRPATTEGWTASNEVKEEKIEDVSRVLYLNGHPLLNTRLLI